MRFFAGVLLLFNAVSVLAVYKDDAYTTDWHIPLIGPSIASATFFHRPDAESRASLIYTLTTRSVLAALNPKDGELVWRQQLADVAGGNGLARGGNGVVVSATGNGVSSFDAGSGRLVWDNEFASKVVDLGVTAGNAVAALFEDGAVRLLAEKTGDVAWEWRGLDRYAFCRFLVSGLTTGTDGVAARILPSRSTLQTRRLSWPRRTLRSNST